MGKEKEYGAYPGSWKDILIALGMLFILLAVVLLGFYLLGGFQPQKTDGTLFIIKNGTEVSRIYLGHQEIMDLCREEQSVIDYKGYVTYCVRDFLDNPISCTTFSKCHEQYMGCGAVNCICEVKP